MSLFDWARERIKPGKVCIDVGPGIRPQELAKFERHICIEPHGEYADWLDARGYETRRWPFIQIHGLRPCVDVDAIFLLDVLEHMPEADGHRALSDAFSLANQVIVFTPLGFYPQSYADGDKDAWGMNGTYWQTHRSGWTPDDFPGWEIKVDPAAHEGHGAFMAIWTRP